MKINCLLKKERMFVKYFIAFIGCILFTTGESVASIKGEKRIILNEVPKPFYGLIFYSKTTVFPGVTRIISTFPPGLKVATGNNGIAIADKLLLNITQNKNRKENHLNLTKNNITKKELKLKGTPGDSIVMADMPLEKQARIQEKNKNAYQKNNGFIISLIIVAITLLIVFLFAAKVRKLQKKMHG